MSNLYECVVGIFDIIKIHQKDIDKLTDICATKRRNQ